MKKAGPNQQPISVRNLITALGAAGLTCSSAGYGMMTPARIGSAPTTSSAASFLRQANQTRGGGQTGAPTGASSKPNGTHPGGPKALDLRALSAYNVQPYQGAPGKGNALPLDQNAIQLLSDSRDAGQLVDLCGKLAKGNGSGPIDDRCMLDQFHGTNQSGVIVNSLVSPFAKPAQGTNWNSASQTLPDAFEGSSRQKQYLANLASYDVASPAVSDDYYGYWTSVSAAWMKNIGQPTPAMDAIWGNDGTTVKLQDGSSVTWKAGPAG